MENTDTAPVVDLFSHQVFFEGKEIKMVPKCFSVLRALVSAKGRTLSREELLKVCWDREYSNSNSRTIDQHIYKIRAALGSAAKQILTVTTVGYRANGFQVKNENNAVGSIARVMGFLKKSPRSAIVMIQIDDPAFDVKIGSKVRLA